MPAGAASSPSPDLQTTVQAVENAAAGAVADATGTAAPTAPGPASDPLPAAPASVAAPITVVTNELGGTALPSQDSTTGSNTTGQSSPVANADAPINACSLSVGLVADASSSCSTTSVGTNEPGGLADANVPITAQDNAIGLLNEAAAALGLSGGQSSASTSQDGDVNADAPVSVCSVNVGLVGNTSSDCDTTGTSGSTSQSGVVDAEVPVTVCDVIAEIDGDSSSNCPQQSDPATQQGQAADLFVPVTACGAVVEVDGSANGMCMPDAGYPLVNDLPTNDASQSAPVDGVVPVNACSVVVAVDGTASNSCEPSHVGATTTGSVPVFAPVTLCAVTAALEGDSSGTCEGTGSTSAPIGSAGSPGTGATVPVTICGIQGALSGRRGLLVPAAHDGCVDGRPGPGRRIAGVVPVGGNADSGGIGLQRFAAEFADGRDGSFERLVAGFNGCPVAARGVDRAGRTRHGPCHQPVGPSPLGSQGSRRRGAFLNVRRAHRLGAGGGQMEGGVMFGHKDAGDVRGLEEVFRSEEFGRGTDSVGRDEVVPPVGPEDVLFTQEFGRPRTVVRLHDPSDFMGPTRTPGGDALEPAWDDDTEESEPGPQADPSGGGAAPGDAGAEAAPVSWNRRSTRYWTLACVSALAALVAAGVTAGSGSSHRPSIAAEGTHGAAQPRRRLPHVRVGDDRPDRSGRQPHRRDRVPVAVVRCRIGRGARCGHCAGRSRVLDRRGDLHRRARFARGFVRQLCGRRRRCRYTGAGGRRQPRRPPAPVASTVGSTVTALGTSVTTAASQVGSSVPAAASTAGAIGNVVTTVDQAVSASTL